MEDRIADTGAQIAIARYCGFVSEGDRLEELAQGAASRVEALFSCLGIDIDAERALNAAIEKGAARIAMAGCLGLPVKLRERLPVLIQQGEREATEFDALLDRLGIDLEG